MNKPGNTNTEFKRRGLYKIKKFYETYSSPEFVTTLMTQLDAYFAQDKDHTKVSAMQTQLNPLKNIIKY
jgi:hypothetical protein